jgi:hypothetical protein
MTPDPELPMTTVADLNETAQRVLIRAAEATARTTRFTRRTSKLTGPLFVQTLVFGWLAHPEATLDELAQTACALGVEISPQGLDERFTRDAAAFLRAVLKRAVHEKAEAEPVALDLLSRFEGVFLLDASQVTLPAELAEVWRGNGRKAPKAGTEAAVKLHVGFDLCRGRLLGPDLTDGKEHDRNADLVARVLPAGSLRVTDLGYFKVGEMARLDRMGVFWLSRFQTKCGFLTADGQAWALDAFLAAQAGDRVEVSILLGLAEQLPCRLLAVRVPAGVAEQRRRRLRERAKARGGTPSAKELALCDWTVYVTNAPPERLSLAEAFVLARLRWQVELVFKLWKSHLKIDEWRTRNPWRILCEVYAKLLGALVQHWILVVTGWGQADRSLVKATRVIRSYVRSLALALQDPEGWKAVMSVIRRCLDRRCRLEKRGTVPSSYQLLSDPQLLGLV